MARVAFPLVLQSPVTGSAIVGAKATITKHEVSKPLGSGAAAEIFLTETEAGKAATNTITSDNTGRWTQGEGAAYAQYWLPEGTYDIVITGTGLTAVTITRELVSGNTLAGAATALTNSWKPGVLLTTDWEPTCSINAGSGAISSTGTVGGTAWIESGGALVYTATPKAAFGPLAAPALPANGKYLSIGVQLKPATAFGGPAAVSLVAGVEKATEAEALAAPAGAVAGAVRIRDVIVKNTAGVYSIVAERDRRPWATGLDYATHAGSVELNTNGESATVWKQRFETSSPSVLFDLSSDIFLTGTGTRLWGGYYLLVDGTLHATWEFQTPIGNGQVAFPLSGLQYIGTGEVNNGSHLWELVAHNFTSGTGTTTRMLLGGPEISLREVRYGQATQNNGSS